MIIIYYCLRSGNFVLTTHDVTMHTAVAASTTTVGSAVAKLSATEKKNHVTEMDGRKIHHRVLCFDLVRFYPFVGSRLGAEPKSFF